MRLKHRWDVALLVCAGFTTAGVGTASATLPLFAGLGGFNFPTYYPAPVLASVNNAGLSVGYGTKVDINPATGMSYGFRASTWAPGLLLRQLEPTQPTTPSASQDRTAAFAVNDAGVIVGQSQSADGKTRMYATVRNGYAILFNLTYRSDEELQSFRQMLSNANFSLK